MTEVQKQRVREVFLAACEKHPQERADFLQRACRRDEAVRQEVEALLAHDDETGTFLSTPALGATFAAASPESLLARGTVPVPTEPATDAAIVDEPPQSCPERIGQYHIEGVLGRGGMAVVYRAEQKNPRRTVALKVIRPGVQSIEMRKRFALESQVLGSLQHPGIAQVFEAGTEATGDGPQPFFAMELVDGQTLTQYAESQRLSVRQRLELMTKICTAVHHAHQKGVIHRDLKPGNILVNRSGEPKIVDFGVARATDADIRTTTLQTDVGQLIGTIAYMSPEQIVGDSRELDTRSDIYALGVILYELLAGHQPHDVSHKTIPQAARIITEEEPASLTSVSRIYRGDIDTIVSKALEKDKTRRYQSALELGSDLRRFLADEPITARSATTVYQLRKFARRNRAAVVAALLVVVALVGGTVVSAVQASIAKREAARVQEINAYFMQLLAAPDPDVDGPHVMMVSVLDRATARIQGAFPNDPATRAMLKGTMAKTYRKLGELDKAEELLESAIALREQHPGEEVSLFSSITELGLLRLDQGDAESARELLERALEGHRRTVGPDDQRTLNAEESLAVALRELGQTEEATRICRSVLDQRLRLGNSTEKEILTNHVNLAAVLMDRGKAAEAEPILQTVLNTRRRLFGEDHASTLRAMNTLAHALLQLERFDEAEELNKQSLTGTRRILGDDHQDTLIAINNLASLYQRRGKHREAEPLCGEAMEVARRVLGERHPNTLAFASNYAALLINNGKFDAAEAQLRRVIDVARESLPADHLYQGAFQYRLGDCLMKSNRLKEAIPHLKDASERLSTSFGVQHPNTRKVIGQLADAYDEIGRPEQASAWRAKLKTAGAGD